MAASGPWNNAFLLYSLPSVTLEVIPPHVVQSIIDNVQSTEEV